MAICRPRGDDGQAAAVVVAVIFVAAVGLVALARLGGVLDDAARARTAADAAALAGVVEGRSGARRLARVNGAELVSFARHGPTVMVVVRVGGRTAHAAAEAVIEWVPP